MNFKKWWKNLYYWKKGGVIGFIIGLILGFLSMMDIWAESSFLGILQTIIFGPFLISAYLSESVLKICSGMGCFVFFILGGIVIYLIIGVIIGGVINKFKND